MSRYFVQRAQSPRADYWWDEPFRPSLTVCDHEPSFTGLLDANGDQIMRAPNPMGFLKDAEW